MSSFVLRALIPKTSTMPMGMDLPRSSWVRLVRLKTCVARFQSHVHATNGAKQNCGEPKELSSYIFALCLLQDPREADLT